MMIGYSGAINYMSYNCGLFIDYKHKYYKKKRDMVFEKLTKFVNLVNNQLNENEIIRS